MGNLDFFEPLAVYNFDMAEILVVDLKKIMILRVVEIQRPLQTLAAHHQHREDNCSRSESNRSRNEIAPVVNQRRSLARPAACLLPVRESELSLFRDCRLRGRWFQLQNKRGGRG